MLERRGYPPGVPCWIDTTHPDPEAAVGFYGGMFGWEFDDRTPAGSARPCLVARLRDREVAAVGSPAPGGAGEPAWRTYVRVDSADAAAATVRHAGGTVPAQPFDVGGAGRAAVVSDPSGAVFCLWEAGAHQGAVLVNEPGTWNWSDLHTRDPESAKAFYAAVFGWEAREVAPGVDDFAMWTLPGYGDHLVRSDPGLRRRHEEGGAPPGFSDAIGWLVRRSGEDGTDATPPGWNVTFAVNDTDAAVSRAEALRGSVVTPPFDAPPVRAAVVSDPQGAVLTVSHYRPRG